MWRPLNYFKNSIKPILSECLSVQINTAGKMIKNKKTLSDSEEDMMCAEVMECAVLRARARRKV